MPSCAQGPASGLKRARGSVRRQGTDWGCAGCARPVLREVCNMLRAAGGQAPAPKAGAARRPGPLRKLSQSQGGGAAEGASSGTWRPAPGAAGQAGLRPHPAGGQRAQPAARQAAASGGRGASCERAMPGAGPPGGPWAPAGPPSRRCTIGGAPWMRQPPAWARHRRPTAAAAQGAPQAPAGM